MAVAGINRRVHNRSAAERPVMFKCDGMKLSCDSTVCVAKFEVLPQ